MSLAALSHVGVERLAPTSLRDRHFPFPTGESSKRDSSLANQDAGEIVSNALGDSARRLRADSRNSSGEAVKWRNRQFYANEMRKRSTRELQNTTKLTPKGIHNVRNELNGLSGDTLLLWMQNDHDFVGEVLEHVGFIRPGEGEFEGAFSKAVNAYVRKQQRGAE